MATADRLSASITPITSPAVTDKVIVPLVASVMRILLVSDIVGVVGVMERLSVSPIDGGKRVMSD